MDVGFIGTGSMGGMLVRALVRSGAVLPGQIWAANRGPEKLAHLADDVPGLHAVSAAEVVRRCRLVFLGVKPAETRPCLDTLEGEFSAEHLLIVMSNMLDPAVVEARVPARVARVIPSLAQMQLAGVSLVTYGPRITVPDREIIIGLLAHISKPYVIPEHLGRICADLTSCGPAFVAAALKAMATSACAIQPDLVPEVADQLVRETVLATALLLVDGGMNYDDIMQRISVPGGITAGALDVMARWAPAGWDQVFQSTRAAEAEKKQKVHL